MDIFTTVLTRVVPVPIKPTSLKVKALLKDAGAGKLKEDLDHLENHDYYFANDKKKGKDQDNSVNEENDQTVNADSTDEQSKDNNDSVVTQSPDGSKHLDLYV